MKVTEYNSKHIVIDFEYSEIFRMVRMAGDEKQADALDKLACLFQKYIDTIADAKKIRTKEILQRARA
jgi:hypothetical protein